MILDKVDCSGNILLKLFVPKGFHSNTFERLHCEPFCDLHHRRHRPRVCHALPLEWCIGKVTFFDPLYSNNIVQ